PHLLDGGDYLPDLLPRQGRVALRQRRDLQPQLDQLLRHPVHVLGELLDRPDAHDPRRERDEQDRRQRRDDRRPQLDRAVEAARSPRADPSGGGSPPRRAGAAQSAPSLARPPAPPLPADAARKEAERRARLAELLVLPGAAIIAVAVARVVAAAVLVGRVHG